MSRRSVGAGVLSGPEILRLLTSGQLVMMPQLYSNQKLRESNTLDLHLGHEFILMRKAEVATLSFEGDLARVLPRFYEQTYVGLGEEFILHPGELALGATLEYIDLPSELMALIVGRSSWGRLGLTIATAIVIHPGYKGCPTLELVNSGNVPICLFPGAPIAIAQITLHRVGRGQGRYSGVYSEQRWVGPTGPGYSRIHEDPMFQRWMEYRRSQRAEREKAQ